MTRQVSLAWQPTCHVESRRAAPGGGLGGAMLLREGLPSRGVGDSAGRGAGRRPGTREAV
jgi:hypothetical protein